MIMKDETTHQVKQAQAGDKEAFAWLVRHFQDRAVGYATAILGDLHHAQDAVQEAFLEAHRSLPDLRSPRAFPAWFRKIVHKYCDRQIRGQYVVTVPLESAYNLCGLDCDPQLLVERREFRDDVHQAILSLPEGERAVVILFYMGQHSQQEIAYFQTLSVSTVKSRLYDARHRLRERMISMVENNLNESRPSRNEDFSTRVLLFTYKFSGMINAGQSIVRSLANIAADQTDPDLRDALTHVRLSVESGSTLSEAMAHHPLLFPGLYIQTIAAGEKADLRIALQHLAQSGPSRTDSQA